MKKILSAALSILMMLTLMPVTQVKASESKDFANVVIFAYFENGNTDDYYDASGEIGTRIKFRSLHDDVYYQDEDVKNALMDMYDGSSVVSLKNYMYSVSDGQFSVHNIFPQYDGDTITPYCITSVSLQDALTGNVDGEIITEILNNVTLPAGTYDYDGDGLVDNLSIILRGGKGAEVGKRGAPSLYSHKSNYGDTSKKWQGSEMKVSTYNMLNTYSIMDTLGGSESGVITHEFMHSIGFPDLYTSDGSEFPVYTWDVMATSARYQSRPLAYMRMKVGGWMDEEDLPVITSTSKGLSLYTQDNKDNTRAYIIKSPLNSSEFFVVEFRKKPTEYNVAALDYYIGGSGIIVYRINPEVEELSNYRGQTGIYVFRPNGNPSGTEALNAYLSSESGRTSIGSNNVSATLEDGALTFSDGTNSGIVISNVSSSAGDHMTFDVTIPSQDEYDTWTNTGFTDAASSEDFYKNVALKEWNGIPYMAACRNGKISLFKYENDAWTQVSDEVTSSYGMDLALEVVNNELYVIYDTNGDNVISKYNQTTQKIETVKSFAGTYMSTTVYNDDLYVSYNKADGWNGTACLGKLSEGIFAELGTYYSGGGLGQTKVAGANGKLYVAVYKANGTSGDIYIKEFTGTTFIDVTDGTLNANTFDMIVSNKNLYVATGGGNTSLKINTYDGNSWRQVTSNYVCFEPSLTLSNGKVYICSTPSDNGKLQVLRYDADNEKVVEEGINIDGYTQKTSFMALNNDLYVAYVRDSDHQIFVKSKRQIATYLAQSYSKSLLLEDYIGLNFHMILDQSVLDDSGAYMKFNIEDGGTQIVKLSEAKLVNGRYRFTCKLNTKQLDNYVTGQMFDSSDHPISKASVSSVKKYVDAVNDIGPSMASYNLVNATYSYGTYAKAYFNGEVIEPTDEMKEITVDSLVQYKSVQEGTMPEGLNFKSSALVLDSALSIRNFFILDEGHDIKEYTFTVNGKTLKPVKREAQNDYYVEIDNITSVNIDTMYKLSVNDSYFYSYSGLTYAYLVLKQNTNQKLMNVVKALYIYNREADKYFTK